jgi:hypothetical protein
LTSRASLDLPADPRFTGRERKRLAILQRRIDVLDHRLRGWRGLDPSWTRAERAALLWVVAVVSGDHALTLETALRVMRQSGSARNVRDRLA